jgi:hypothetical protein
MKSGSQLKSIYLWTQIEWMGYRAIQITEISAHYRSDKPSLALKAPQLKKNAPAVIRVRSILGSDELSNYLGT